MKVWFWRQDVNKRLRLAGYRIDYLVADSKGNSAESIRGMTDHYLNGTLAFIGPENTCAFEARVAAAWNLPMIGFVSRCCFPDIILSYTEFRRQLVIKAGNNQKQAH